MIEAGIASSARDFQHSVIAECERARPLGAYADAAAAHYLFLGGERVYARSRALDESRRLCAVSGARPLFTWDEREMADDFGIVFEDAPDERPFRFARGGMPDPIVAWGEGVMHFVVGPVHAGIIEPGRFTFSSGGETIVHLDAQLGYGHRGVEAALAGVPALDAVPKVARICGSCSAARSFAYALALERLAHVEVPAPVELARLVIAELERVYNHVADLAASASGAGYAVGFARGMALKERAMRLCEAASGHRLLFDAIVPGGLGAHVLERGFGSADLVRALEQDVRRYVDALFANGSLVSRWRHAGTVPRTTATACGAVGPASRASHGDIDLRRAAPYGAYAVVPVSVAQRSTGDAFARCEVKREELAESFRLIRLALGELQGIDLPLPAPIAPEAGTALAAVEGPRGAEIVALHVGAQGRIERLHVISASYRNWPIVARAMEGNIVPDFPLVNKSFNLCYACADR